MYFYSVPINASTQNHHYKSFLHNLITTSRYEKYTGEVSGYTYEQPLLMDSYSLNFIQRRNWFLDGNKEYKKTVRLAGPIYHDLVSKKGLFEIQSCIISMTS